MLFIEVRRFITLTLHLLRFNQWHQYQPETSYVWTPREVKLSQNHLFLLDLLQRNRPNYWLGMLQMVDSIAMGLNALLIQ